MASLIHPARQFSPVDPAVPLSDLTDLRLTDEARVVHEIEGRLNASYDESRYIRTYDWRRNWEFAFAGNQWIYWNAEIPDFVPLPIPEELRYTENQLIGTIKQAVNMMVQGDPAYDCVPLNSDWDSREAARMAKPLLYTYGRENNLGRLRVQNILDEQVFGFGIRKTYWQSAGGGVTLQYRPELTPDGAETGQPRVNLKTGEAMIEPGTMRYVGEMRQDAVSPFNFFPQVGCEGPYLERMDYCITAEWVSPAWVKRAYQDIDFDEQDLERFQTMPYQLMQPGDLNWNIFGQSPNRRAPNGKTLMLTYYQIPAPVEGHEHGLEIRICGQHVLNPISGLQTCPEKPPYKATIPFTVYAATPRRGTFYPRPPVSDYIEPQMRINQCLSNMYTHASLCSAPNLLTTKGDMTPDTVSFGHEKWKIPQGIEDPRWLASPPVPEWLFAMKQQAAEALDRVSMNFGATRGERSKGDPSGYYVDVLREHDQIDLLAEVRDHARAHEQEGQMFLVLAKKFEPAERILTIVGQNGRSQVFRFIKSKLQPEKVQVVVQATTLLPSLVTSRQRAVMELYEKGFWAPPGQLTPPVRRQLLKFINMPGLFETEDLDSDDVRLSERNHSAILDESKIPFPATAPEGVDPEQFKESMLEAVQAGKGFMIDPDWDPNELIPLAIARKKEDDAVEWPPEVRTLFEQYILGLKQLQSMQAKVQQDAAMEAAKAQMAMEIELDAAKQQNQAKGRAQVKVAGEVAKALLGPDPHQVEQTKGDIATSREITVALAEKLFNHALPDAQPEGSESAEKKEK